MRYEVHAERPRASIKQALDRVRCVAVPCREEEWRLVSTRIIDGDPCNKFREGGFSVVPFVYFKLRPIRECVVGPSIDQHLSARAAEQLCNGPLGRLSGIPYRSLS